MRRALVPTLATLLLLASGCGVRRVLVIDSRPAGARVFVNGTERGTTPLRIEYVHDGLYSLRLEKEGYAPRAEEVRTPTTIDAVPGVDFFAEHFGPHRERVTARMFELAPLQRTPYTDGQMDETLGRAEDFRKQMHREVEEPGTPAPTRPAAPPSPPAAAPASGGARGAPPTGR